MHPSYIKDSYHFVVVLGELKVPPNTLLFTINVESLYINIETHRALEVVCDIFDKHPDPKRPDSYILELLEITLTRNDFEFHDKAYLQTCGCAMGHKYSPAFANIYLAKWEKEALELCHKQPLLNTHLRNLKFFSPLNNYHPRIKLQHILYPVKVNFLDTEVSFRHKEDTLACKQLATKVYFKETDRHALLHKLSFHPRHTFKGIIKIIN